MLKFLSRFAQFLIFALGFYIVAIIVWGEFAPAALQKNLNYRLGYGGHLHTRARSVEQYENVDLLFLGSSHTYRGFDPRVFAEAGYTSFNLGSSSQTPLQTLYLLRRYLEKLNPKRVVFEVYPDNFISDGVESSLDFVANLPWGADLFKMATQVNHIKTWNTLLFATYKHFSQQNNLFKQPDRQGSDLYIQGGYVQRDSALFLPNQHTYTEGKRWDFHALQLEAFRSILDLLKTKQIPVLLVQSPVTSLAFKGYINNQEVDSFFISTGAPYLNFNELLKMDDRNHFYDTDHLNQKGVERFNLALIDKINTIWKD